MATLISDMDSNCEMKYLKRKRDTYKETSIRKFELLRLGREDIV